MKEITKEMILNSTALISCGDYGTINIPMKDIIDIEIVEELLDNENKEHLNFELEDYAYEFLTSILNIDITL